MWPLTVSTRVFYKKLYDRFTGQKKSGRNNEVTIRQVSTVFCRTGRS